LIIVSARIAGSSLGSQALPGNGGFEALAEKRKVEPSCKGFPGRAWESRWQRLFAVTRLGRNGNQGRSVYPYGGFATNGFDIAFYPAYVVPPGEYSLTSRQNYQNFFSKRER